MVLNRALIGLLFCVALDAAIAADEGNSTNSTTVIKKFIYTECQTPNGDEGFCMQVQQCSKLVAQLNNPDAHEFLRNSSCLANNPGWVCCGEHNNFLNKLTTQNSNNKVAPEEIQSRSSLPGDCGRSISIPNRIIGGEYATLGEFPWMARLMHTDKNGYEKVGCAGFIIHRRYVVTAAHCLKPKLLNILGNINKIIIGEHDTTTDPDCEIPTNSSTCAPNIMKKDLKDAIIHPLYDPDSRTQANDIALIHIKGFIEFNDYTKPICLPTMEATTDASSYVLTGWGKTESFEESTIKMKVEVPLANFNVCKQQYLPLNISLTSKQICAGGNEGKDSCSGDSGGPLMYLSRNRWYAAGVVSFGVGCGKRGWPAVYTNIQEYRQWIEDTITSRRKKKNTNT